MNARRVRIRACPEGGLLARYGWTLISSGSGGGDDDDDGWTSSQYAFVFVAGAYPQLLQSISPLFSIDTSGGESSAACVDNAAAAVTRMIMACPNHVPMAQVLPVMLKALPFKVDVSENETVYRCLLRLLQMNQPDLIANKIELQRVFTEATLEGSEVPAEIQNQLKQALQSL